VKGWDSSFTGEPIPDHEVAAWMEQTVDRVLALKARRVREIGCGGSGLMLFRIAPHSEEYTATDLSANALSVLRHQIDGMAQPPAGVRLLPLPAHGPDMAPESLDLVLVVSVS
jgi:predicted TPR repeat methyltransferase